MNRCPSCNAVIAEGSAICPECGAIIDEKNANGLDNELERFSQMVFEMENNLGSYSRDMDFANNVYTKPQETADTTATQNNIGDNASSTNVVSDTPIVFRASKKGIVKAVEEPEEEQAKENVEDTTEEQAEETKEEVKDESTQTQEVEPKEEVKETEEETTDESAQTQEIEPKEEAKETEEETTDEPAQTQEVKEESKQEETEEEIKEEEIKEEDIKEEDILTEEEEKASKEYDEFIEKQYNEFLKQTHQEELSKETASEEGEDENTLSSSENSNMLDKEDIDIFNLDLIDDVLNSENELSKDLDLDYLKIPPENEEPMVFNASEASKTYLKLNFVTTDKFATLISNENEISDTEEDKNLGDQYVSKYINLYDTEAIISSEILSDEELSSTMKAVVVQRNEFKQSLELEDKEVKINTYKRFRNKFFNGVKAVMVFGLILFCFYLYPYITEKDSVSLKSDLYEKAMIEQYDSVLYNSIVEIVAIDNEAVEAFNLYEKGEMTKEDLIKLCIDLENRLNNYYDVFDKPVYDEAELYLFSAKNVYFFSSYYIENLENFAETGDEYYKYLNRIMRFQVDDILTNEASAREDFLHSVGFSDDEISILNLKLKENQ